MKLFAIIAFVAGALFMSYGFNAFTTTPPDHPIHTAIWSIGGAQIILLSAILWTTAKPLSSYRNPRPKN